MEVRGSEVAKRPMFCQGGQVLLLRMGVFRVENLEGGQIWARWPTFLCVLFDGVLGGINSRDGRNGVMVPPSFWP